MQALQWRRIYPLASECMAVWRVRMLLLYDGAVKSDGVAVARRARIGSRGILCITCAYA